VGFRIDWTTEAGQLAAIEPEPAEITEHAAQLAIGYNDPANAPLMGQTEPMLATEVVDHYLDMTAEGARQFLLFADDALVGDADLRGLTGDAAEFAFMIAAPGLQGKGLGTRFALMVHAFGFRELGLARVYASVVPHNTASRRVFEKLGYALDDSAAARAFADEPGDVVLAIDRATFELRNAEALAHVRVSTR
jgi:RimJ/RimL family protein N-acetyltransferase